MSENALEVLVDELYKNGIVVEGFEITGHASGEPKKVLRTVFELNFSEHDKAFEDKYKVLKEEYDKKCKDYKSVSALLSTYQQENESLKKRIIELENFSCQAEQETESLVEKLKQRIAELESKETETCEKEPISDDCRPSMEWYENRHQSDCIEINRLNTTIDVLIHKVEYLRQFAGLE